MSLARKHNFRQLLTKARSPFNFVFLSILALAIVTPLIVFVVKVTGQGGGSELVVG